MSKNKEEKEALAVYDDFSHTKYGHTLQKHARYERFRPIDYPVKYWGRLLGQDVNNLRHMKRSITVARWFTKLENSARPKPFLARERLLLTVTAALHDQAEAITGDIPFGQKSPVQRRKELQILRSYEAAFAPRLKGPALRLYRIGRDKIAFANTKQKLPAAFKTIELLSFMQNALIACHRIEQLLELPLSSKHAKYLGITSAQERKRIIVALERLSAEVLGSGVISRLIELGDRFPSAHVFLHSHAKEITVGLHGVTHDTFLWYSTGEDPTARRDEQTRRIHNFDAQKKIWEAWLQSQKNKQ